MQKSWKGKLWVKPNNTYNDAFKISVRDIFVLHLTTARAKHHLKSMFGTLEPPYMLHA